MSRSKVVLGSFLSFSGCMSARKSSLSSRSSGVSILTSLQDGCEEEATGA